MFQPIKNDDARLDFFYRMYEKKEATKYGTDYVKKYDGELDRRGLGGNSRDGGLKCRTNAVDGRVAFDRFCDLRSGENAVGSLPWDF